MQQAYMFQMERMDVWNNRKVVKPPCCTLEYTADECQNSDIDECIMSLKNALSSLETKLQNNYLQGCFNLETRILKMLISQTRQHRVDKVYGLLKKIHRCAKCWQEMNLVKYVAKLSKMMPFSQERLRSVRIPSSQMFEYLMVRMYGAYQLLVALETCCRETVPYLMAKIVRGHSYWTAMTYFAIIARFRVLSLDFASHLARTYDDIYPWIKHLKGAFKWDFMSENSTSLEDSLRMHCKNAETDETWKEIKNLGLAVCKLDVLDIFDHRKNMELVNNVMSENQEKTDTSLHKSALIHTNESNKKKKSIHPKHKEKMIKNIASWRNFSETDTTRRNEAVGEQVNLKEKEEVLSLLSLFDENVNGKPCDSAVGRYNSFNHSKLGLENTLLCKESESTVGPNEDIGEIAENEGASGKKKIRKRKRGDNKNTGSRKTKKSKFRDGSILKQFSDNTAAMKSSKVDESLKHEPMKKHINSVKHTKKQKQKKAQVS